MGGGYSAGAGAGHGPTSVSTATLLLTVGDRGGTATLIPQELLQRGSSSSSSSGGDGRMPVEFALTNSTLCMRPAGCGPMEDYNAAHGSRFVYFLKEEAGMPRKAAVASELESSADAAVSEESNKGARARRKKATTLVLHIDGWDLFADRSE